MFLRVNAPDPGGCGSRLEAFWDLPKQQVVIEMVSLRGMQVGVESAAGLHRRLEFACDPTRQSQTLNRPRLTALIPGRHFFQRDLFPYAFPHFRVIGIDSRHFIECDFAFLGVLSMAV